MLHTAAGGSRHKYGLKQLKFIVYYPRFSSLIVLRLWRRYHARLIASPRRRAVTRGTRGGGGRRAARSVAGVAASARTPPATVTPGDQRAPEDMHVQGRCRLARAAPPPQIRATADSDGVENSALDSAEARGAGAVPGVALQRELEPHALAVGAQPKHAPRAFAFRVGARSLAGAVVAAQAAREITRFAGVGRGPALRLEDVAAESGTGRSCGHDRAGRATSRLEATGIVRSTTILVWRVHGM